jgi:putative PIN family toxin of toxin-antitoxin system
LLRVTADTNILVSGINYLGSKPFQLLELARAGKINLTVSEAILGEMEDVLGRKFAFRSEGIAEARRRIVQMARTVTPSVELDVVKDDPPDNRILECAVSAGSDYIVTGDRHLLRMRQYAGIRILTVSDFLEVGMQQSRRADL